MIFYPSARFHPRHILQLAGSVAPFSCAVAVPCAILTATLKCMSMYVFEGELFFYVGLDKDAEISSAAFSGITFLLGFLIVFRTSQAYLRFWEGCSAIHQMQGEWFDAASGLVAFCKMSSAKETTVVIFHHTLVRLFSVLNATILMELSAGFVREDLVRGTNDRAFELELIDALGLDSESLATLNAEEDKVELLFQWIQALIVENFHKDVFSVPAPILSRSFQELRNGISKYYEAKKIATIPFPFPYMQTTEVMLILHWIVSPILICVWVDSPVWSFILSFMQVCFLWSVHAIAGELENPFGQDDNDLPAREMQRELNRKLLLLIRPGTLRTAHLAADAALSEASEDPKSGRRTFGTEISMSRNGVNNQTPQARIQSRRISLGILQQSIHTSVNCQIVNERAQGGRPTIISEMSFLKVNSMEAMSVDASASCNGFEDDFPRRGGSITSTNRESQHLLTPRRGSSVVSTNQNKRKISTSSKASVNLCVTSADTSLIHDTAGKPSEQLLASSIRTINIPGIPSIASHKLVSGVDHGHRDSPPESWNCGDHDLQTDFTGLVRDDTAWCAPGQMVNKEAFRDTNGGAMTPVVDLSKSTSRTYGSKPTTTSDASSNMRASSQSPRINIREPDEP